MDGASAGAITAAVAAAAGSAGTEAGRQAWESLLALGRRIAHRPAPDADADAVDEVAEAELVEADVPDEAQVRTFAAWLIAEGRPDPAFAAEIAAWAQQHGLAVTADHSTVHNTVCGTAQITGPLIQGRDFHGPLTSGG